MYVVCAIVVVAVISIVPYSGLVPLIPLDTFYKINNLYLFIFCRGGY